MNDKRTEVMLNKSLWWNLKTIAMSKNQTLSALFRDVLGKYVTDYEQTKKTTGIKPVRKE